MAYGFNEDKTKVNVVTEEEFEGAGLVKVMHRTVSLRTTANAWTSVTLGGFPETTDAVIPVFTKGNSPTNPSTIWASGITAYIQKNSATQRTLIVSSTRSDRIDVTVDLIVLYR